MRPALESGAGAADALVIDDSDSINWEALVDRLAPLSGENWTFGPRAATLVGPVNFLKIIEEMRTAMSGLPDHVKEAARSFDLRKDELVSLALCPRPLP